MKFNGIKAFLFDVDGVMTDGGIYYDTKGNEFKKFNVKDGQICKHLKEYEILLGIITGRESAIVERRFMELEFDFIRQGVADKVSALDDFCTQYSLNPRQVCYAGDDINDLEVIRKVGLSFCPYDAVDFVKEEVDCVLKVKGGEGVLRVIADKFLKKVNGYNY